MITRSTTVLCSLIGLLAVLLVASPGTAQALSCGDKVKHDVTLHADLDCSSSGTDGLHIGKRGVTIDLNGHTILGGGTKDGIWGRKDRTTIRNGRIESFDDGVYLAGGANSVVHNLYVKSDPQSCAYGIYLESLTGAMVSDNKVANGCSGIYLTSGSANAVARNRVVRVSQSAIYIDHEAHDRTAANKALKGAGGPYVTGFYDGTGAHNVFSHNVVRGAGFAYGFELDYPFDVTVRRSTGNATTDTGLYIYGNDPADGYSATVKHNTFNDNDSYGGYAEYQGTRGGDNVALRNPSGCYHVSCNR